VDERHIINIRNNVDVIMMRTEVRNIARKIGMDMMDQASISLAASSLAHALGLGCTQEGQVMIEQLLDNSRIGLRVICMNDNKGETFEIAPKTLQDAQWMVDELTVETLPTTALRVTLVKWMS